MGNDSAPGACPLSHCVRGIIRLGCMGGQEAAIRLAALLAFLIGYAGAVVGMDHGGMLAWKFEGYGSDIDAWTSIAFVCVAYLPLRWWEPGLVIRIHQRTVHEDCLSWS